MGAAALGVRENGRRNRLLALSFPAIVLSACIGGPHELPLMDADAR